MIISPGSATPLDSSVVQIDGAPDVPARPGNVRFLTVRVSTSDPNVWRVVTAWLDPDRDVEERSDVVGCLTDAQNQEFNTELMDQSQNDAKYVALTRLGYTVHGRPGADPRRRGVPGAPAYGERRAGRPGARGRRSADVTDVGQIGSIVQSHQPGDDVHVTFDRNGATRTATDHRRQGRSKARRTRRACRRRGRPAGPRASASSSQEFVTYQFPINVKINTAARRRAVGRPRVHARDHRRPHAGRASPAASGWR